MTTVLELISGDKANPTRSLDLAEGVTTGNIFLQQGGFNPGPGRSNILWSGQSPRFDGQKRHSSSRDNATFSLTYDLSGGSAAELGWLQREIIRFFEDAGWYQEARQGEKVWLRYRWHDNLDLSEPVFGQFSHFLEILAGEIQWPQTLHNGAITAGNIGGVIAEFTTKPYAEGLRQICGDAKAHIELYTDGVLIGGSDENKFTNPSYGHATWNNGWTASHANLVAEQETRPVFTRSLLSATRLKNNDTTGTDRTWTQTLTLTAAGYILSFRAKRPDSAAVTQADCVVWGQGAARTTTFISVGDGWYLCYASFTAAASSSTHGVQVKANREIIVDDFQVERSTSPAPTPFLAGHLSGCAWSGTAHASTSTPVGGAFTEAGIQYDLSDIDLNGGFTIAGWIKPLWAAGDITDDLITIVEYSTDGNNYIKVDSLTAGNNFNLNKKVANTGGNTNLASTHSYGDWIHLAIRQPVNSDPTLYINGDESSVTLNATGTDWNLPSGGNLRFATSENPPGPADVGTSAVFDGWRMFPAPALTAAQILQLYNNELPIKTAGGVIGMPPFWWTKDGDGILDAVNDSNRDNWGIIGGVSGDVPALTEFQVQLPTATPPEDIWLGLKSANSAFPPANFWLELQGTVDAGSSEGEYQSAGPSAGAAIAEGGPKSERTSVMSGRVQFLARLRVQTNSININPYFLLRDNSINGEDIDGDSVTIAVTADMRLRDLGEMTIGWPNENFPADFVWVAAEWTATTGSSTVWTDFIFLLPYPNTRIVIGSSLTIASGDKLVVMDGVAFVKATGGSQTYFTDYQGTPIEVLPNKYNYLFMALGAKDAAYDITDTATFEVYITPRFLLSGGPIA